MKKVSLISVFIIIVLFIFIMYLALFPNNTAFNNFSLTGEKPPPFNLTTFDGHKLSSGSLNNKAVVLNFWASWCIPCVEEVVVLNRSYKKFQDKDIVFIGVNIWDDRKDAVNFINKYRPVYPNGFDPDNEIQVNYGIAGVPETYFISKEGVIVNRFQGQLTDNIADYFFGKVVAE